MSTKFPKEFLLTDAEKTKYQYEYIKENLRVGQNHNFAVISEKPNIPLLQSSAACTGGLPNFVRYNPEDLGRSTNPNIAFISKPYKTKNQNEYLNTLLSPITSPYRWWMTSDKYKVTLTKDGNVDMWFCLDPSLSIAEVHGLAILERIYNQHANNPFWEIWKESGLPFEAFFYLTHTYYGGFHMGRFINVTPQRPYSAFNMFMGLATVSNGYTGTKKDPEPSGFSAPRFFQMKPNHEYVKRVTCADWKEKPEKRVFPTVGNPERGMARANSIWDSYNSTPERILTDEFETKLKAIFKETYLSYSDSYNMRVHPSTKWNLPGQTNWDWLKNADTCREANMIRINKVIDLLKEYTPNFLSEKVV